MQLALTEDIRYASADTDVKEREIRDNSEKIENLRTRIIAFDLTIMSVGSGDGYYGSESEIEFDC